MAINEHEFVILPVHADGGVFKYNSASDEWKEMVGLARIHARRWGHAHAYDKGNGLLLISDGNKLQSINFAKDTKTEKDLALGFQVESMIVVAAEIHLFGYNDVVEKTLTALSTVTHWK